MTYTGTQSGRLCIEIVGRGDEFWLERDTDIVDMEPRSLDWSPGALSGEERL